MTNNIDYKRTEQDIFSDLEKVCQSSGFIHCIALLCFRDDFVKSNKDIAPTESFKELYRPERLNRNEISALLGLAVKTEIDFSIPDIETSANQIKRSEELLAEFHDTFHPDLSSIPASELLPSLNEYLASGNAAREGFFYSGESAYSFQYIQFAKKRYNRDSEWIEQHCGFTIDEACLAISTIIYRQNTTITRQLNKEQDKLVKNPETHPTLLPGFSFTAKEIADESCINEKTVRAVIDAFQYKQTGNQQYLQFGQYNEICSHPIIEVEEGVFSLLQHYCLAESLYESPKFWFKQDPIQEGKLAQHRGEFLESACYDLLSKVFGVENVHKNVELYQYKKRDKLGEIDLFVNFGNIGIVVQAKSKPLTIQAKLGDRVKITEDFEKAIQSAYDQCTSCAKVVLSKGVFGKLYKSNIQVKIDVEEVYAICVTSEFIPSLMMLASKYLSRVPLLEAVYCPIILELFSLDVISEFLATPLDFISYLERRSKYDEVVTANHELTILAFHLRMNLWLSTEYDKFYFGDDICCELDQAMYARRVWQISDAIPPGILTPKPDSTLWKLLSSIKESRDRNKIIFGLNLLKLSGEAFASISKLVDAAFISARSRGHSDFSLPGSSGLSGTTIHCNNFDYSHSLEMLVDHIKLKMYSEKESKWIGVCIDPIKKAIRFVIVLNSIWIPDPILEEAAAGLSKPLKLGKIVNETLNNSSTGRNDKCPCGSGKKFKKCCNRPT